MPLIQIEHLTQVYGKGDAAITALDHVNLSVEAGECLAIMGPSGCGKSTLLHLLGGLDRPTEGRVTIDGHSLDKLAEALLLAAIGTAFGLLAGLYLGYVLVLGLSVGGFPVAYTFPLTGIVGATAAGLVFGVLPALIPARQVAQLEIIRALRYE